MNFFLERTRLTRAQLASPTRNAAINQVCAVVLSILFVPWLTGCSQYLVSPPGRASTQLPGPDYDALIFFGWDSFCPSPRMELKIAYISDRYREQTQNGSPFMIHVVGYTDASGPASYNIRLGLRRAQRIAVELERLGWDHSHILIGSCGARFPLVPGSPGVREPQNRRVEFLIRPIDAPPDCPVNSPK